MSFSSNYFFHILILSHVNEIVQAENPCTRRGVKKPGNQSHLWNTSAHNYQNIQKMKTCLNFFKLQTFLCSLKCAPRSACPSGIVVRSRKKCERPKSGPFSGSFYPKSWFEPVVLWLSSDKVIKRKKKIVTSSKTNHTRIRRGQGEAPMKVYARPPWAKPKPAPKGIMGKPPDSAKMGGALGMTFFVFMVVIYRTTAATQVRN